MFLYDGRVVRRGLNIKRMVVRFSVRPEFARAKVQCDVKEASFDHVRFSGYLQAMLLKCFQNIFSNSFGSRAVVMRFGGSLNHRLGGGLWRCWLSRGKFGAG